MIQLSRRNFLMSASAGALLLATGRAHGAPAFRLGSQSYSFRTFPLEGAIAQLKALGLDEMEFFGGHVPTDPESEEFAAAKALITESGIRVPCFGVESFTADDAANRKKFEFGKALGVDILTADPTLDSFDSLDRLTTEFGIRIAIHNHGPGARYDKVADTLKAVEGRSPMIGACLDTGHCIRSGEKPHEAVEQLGARLISLHLKDWEHGGEEKIVGEGDLDIDQLAQQLAALSFDGPIMLEYEESPENPVPDMKVGVANWKQAVEKAAG
jgi:inosose dehydratase